MNAVIGLVGLIIFTTLDFENAPLIAALIVVLFVLLVIERRSRRNECSKIWKEVHRGN
ncbi:hypothetical protein [Alteromonas sp. C1M14]|uniref:hypothetical protein n=1 Tax=Alteromonas sp. C1M14 TaxID=2841567 RepID=UPI001C08C09F|nr:hypothetical protein [Alteromonas sp. C1M14]MBU2979031.1 hypothetical protein [Alteromonas sp. C1M14]